MMKPRYLLVAFDLDGTLTDTLTSIAVSCNAALSDLGQAPLDIEAFPGLIGYGARRLVEGFLERTYGSAQDDPFVDDAFALYRKHFAEHCTVGVQPYKGIPELLHELKNAGVRLAIISNKPHRETVQIVDLVFPGIFDAVHGQKDDGPRKPDPAVLHELLDDFSVAASDACMVGDGDTDVEVGQHAGVDQIACGWGYRPAEDLQRLNPTAFAPDVPTLRSLLLQTG